MFHQHSMFPDFTKILSPFFNTENFSNNSCKRKIGFFSKTNIQYIPMYTRAKAAFGSLFTRQEQWVLGLLRPQTECSFKTSNRKILPDPYRPFLARSLGDSSGPFLTPLQILGPSKPPYSPLLGRSLESHSRLPYRSSSRVPSIPHYCSSLEYLVILPIITTLFWQKEPPSDSASFIVSQVS